MKICIWCRQNDTQVTFNNKAHTIPQSLGGKNICENVCDKCNSYFGNIQNRIPSIETVIKETFNISRLILLDSSNEVGKNKALARFKSELFNVNLKQKKVRVKPKYSLRQNFQKNMARQLKRGIYKVYLEERERQKGDALNEKYDFIREFSRYNLGDFPLIYFRRKNGIMMMLEEWNKSPELIFDERYRMKYLLDNHNFFEFELLGHVLAISTSRNFVLSRDTYIKETKKVKEELFSEMFPIEKFNDFDLTLKIMAN
ncbi:HNH endonuclease [Allomuricauda sp. ARW1Y1]|jgi:hypothetical protein|uniref:HNH endonuclease n=1 Tax=Allomuricauda sp. ARW1Y1 TaxID=2663843 RepID=UPI0015C859C2|nr:HNH endonuclease [Muricauda sp. ARW1Y1]NYJ25971.1 hypothetical protein [Muricauda sp. ARW1Y1]